jgi:hypothetical protein
MGEWLVAGGWSGERPDQSVDQSAHLLDQVQICRKIPLRKVAESDRTQSDCETIGILEDEDDDDHEDDSSNSAAVTPASALPFERMNLTPRRASAWFLADAFPNFSICGLPSFLS